VTHPLYDRMVRRQEFLKVDEIIAATHPTTYNGYEHPPLRACPNVVLLRARSAHLRTKKKRSHLQK
ncbi:MAG: hypothetical protein HC789_08285, partial [Microcoleus sp. CSU_2_2]|nr:hypothetical protein [Microcoleus sp. CSU_2_2]